VIVVRSSEDRTAVVRFLFRVCMEELRPEVSSAPFTPQSLAAVIRSWLVVELYDTEKEVVIGAISREPNGFVHIYVDGSRRASWKPHTSLQAALDIFLSDCDTLYAGIPEEHAVVIRIVRKLGFVHVRTEGGIALYLLTSQTRKRWRPASARG